MAEPATSTAAVIAGLAGGLWALCVAAAAGIRNRLPTASADACRQTSATALDVFGECTATVERLAAAADGHASDVKTLTDACPK